MYYIYKYTYVIYKYTYVIHKYVNLAADSKFEYVDMRFCRE